MQKALANDSITFNLAVVEHVFDLLKLLGQVDFTIFTANDGNQKAFLDLGMLAGLQELFALAHHVGRTRARDQNQSINATEVALDVLGRGVSRQLGNTCTFKQQIGGTRDFVHGANNVIESFAHLATQEFMGNGVT